MTRQQSSPGRGTQPFPGHRSTLILAIGTAVLVLVAAIVLWRPAGPASQSPSPTATAPTDASGPAATDQTVPSTAPTDVQWRTWHAVALPFSASAGPRRENGQAVWGFSHDPEGALIAAAQAVSRNAAAIDPGWQQVAATMVAPGPGRDAWVKNRQTVTVTQVPGPGSFAQIAGFTFVSYTPGNAVIQLVTRSSDGTLHVANLAMTWLGDWKLLLAPDGGDARNTQTVPSLTGFVPWGGV